MPRDRLIFLGGATVISAMAWLYLVRMTSHTADFLPVFAMWSVMMVAMMLPSALPFVFAFGAEHRRRRAQGLPYVPAGVFLAGYFAMWTVFSALTAWIQQLLHHFSLLSHALTATSSALAGGILIAAGVYQWTPFKEACLRHCRTPLMFLLSDWREGKSGAFRMGLDHGLFCIGCCWLLMTLPFAAGVMNLGWMAAITAFILVEKAVPGGQWFGRICGGALAGAGAWMILA